MDDLISAIYSAIKGLIVLGFFFGIMFAGCLTYVWNSTP